MTEQPDGPPEVEGEPVRTLDDLAEKVDEIFTILKGSHGEAGSETEPAQQDVSAEVRAELAKLKQAEDRKAARDAEKAAHEARLAAVEEKVKEKPPAEYRRVTRWMGWAGDKDGQ